MIYIDPPYNTGNDFVYGDDFKDPIAHYKEVTSQATKSNPETMGRFHTAWLNMMYPRLRLAANLLRDDGVIFVSIDNGEAHNLRKLCDEVFGEENFIDMLSWFKKASPSNDAQYFSNDIEYVFVYAKSKEVWRPNRLPLTEKQMKYYQNPDNDPRGAWNSATYTCNKNKTERPNLYYPITNPFSGEEVYPKETAVWAYSKEQCAEHIKEDMLFWGVDGTAKFPRFKKFLSTHQGVVNRTLWHYDDVNHTQGASEELKRLEILGFSTPKPTRLIKRMLQIATNLASGDIILDFFSGSATTAHAVMQLNAEDGGNRRFVMVQLPEVTDEKSEAYKAGYKNICEIGKERIRRAGKRLVNTEIDKTELSKNIEFRTDVIDNLEKDVENKLTKEGGIYETIGLSTMAEAQKAWLDEEKTTLMVQDNIEKGVDIGFRVFKLDTSNLKIWDNTPIPEFDLVELERRLRGMLEVIKEDRSNIDVVYEVMLKLGQDLCEDIVELDINGKIIYGIGANVTFMVCLAPSITPEDAEAMAEYAPGRIIFSEQCFDSTTDKSNVKLTMRDRGITMRML